MRASRSNDSRNCWRDLARPSLISVGRTTSRTLKFLLFGEPPMTNGACCAPRKFGPPERGISGATIYAGNPLRTPRLYETTEPKDGWNVTNAPQPTGTGVGAPVMR